MRTKPFLDHSSVYIILAIASAIFLSYGVASLGKNQDAMIRNQKVLMQNQEIYIQNQEDIHEMLDSIMTANIKIENEIKK